MIARAGSGWQTLLADLAIILFMVTAAALSQARESAVAAPPQPSPRGEPLAIWRAGVDVPPLGPWLAAQSGDPRQQLTILVQFPRGGQRAALDQAQALLGQAGAAGVSARLVIEPGTGGTLASLAFDLPDAGLAQSLLGSMSNTPVKETTP